MAHTVNITLTGASGFVGQQLLARLLADGHAAHVLGRSLHKGTPPAVRFSVWDATESDPPEESLAEADAIVNLAGEPVGQRWGPAVKKRILASRVEGTQRLVRTLARLEKRPAVLVSASAVGFYGDRGDQELTERSGPGKGFLKDVCTGWEAAADQAEPLGVRVVKLRLGVVLGKDGGVLARTLPTFRWGLGGVLGTGRQWVSWIHIGDLLDLIRYAIEQPGLHGVVNATAPNPATNAEFTRVLASLLHRPALFHTPDGLLRLLFGEGAELLFSSQRVLPEAAEAAGFKFRFTTLEPALRDLLG
jgi:uncharacterized protein